MNWKCAVYHPWRWSLYPELSQYWRLRLLGCDPWIVEGHDKRGFAFVPINSGLNPNLTGLPLHVNGKAYYNNESAYFDILVVYGFQID